MPVEFVVLGIVKSVIGGAVMIGFAFSPIGRAIGQRILHGKRPAVMADDPRVDELVEDQQSLRRQLDEMNERVDFAERMLAQSRAAGALGTPRT